MKNIKETIIGVFAVIGFVVIASGFSINNTMGHRMGYRLGHNK
jgi:hypothetical protein